MHGQFHKAAYSDAKFTSSHCCLMMPLAHSAEPVSCFGLNSCYSKTHWHGGKINHAKVPQSYKHATILKRVNSALFNLHTRLSNCALAGSPSGHTWHNRAGGISEWGVFHLWGATNVQRNLQLLDRPSHYATGLPASSRLCKVARLLEKPAVSHPKRRLAPGPYPRVGVRRQQAHQSGLDSAALES